MLDIPKLTRLYAVLLRAAWMKAFEYRWQTLFWLLAGVFPLVMMAVWLALTSEIGAIQGWNSADFITYYVLAVLVQQTTVSYISFVLADRVQQGELSTALLKPVHPLHSYIVLETLGYKLLILAALIPFVIIVAVLTGMIRVTANPLYWLAFGVALLFGFLLNTLLGAILGAFSFWTTQASAFAGFLNGFEQFLSGSIAPLALFSTAIQTVAVILPFRSQLGFPIEILMGRLNDGQVVQGLIISATWVAIFWFSFHWVWTRGLRRYEGVGA